MSSATKTMGKRISEQRRLAGLTQAALAEKLGIASETVSRMETGSAMPSLVRIEAIARALDVEMAELFRATRKRTPEGDAIDRLVWIASRRSLEEVELLTSIAGLVFGARRAT